MSNYIRKIEDSGKLIILEDSSKWEVSSYDAFTTRMWMVMDNVSVSLNKMTYNGPQNLDSVISYTWEIKGGGPSGTNAKEVSTFI